MLTELLVYAIDTDKRSNYWLWLLYVLGRPMTFLPVTILAWRLRKIYVGCFNIRRLRFKRPHHQLQLGDKWLLSRLFIGLLPFIASYPFIVLYGGAGDALHVAFQGIALLFFAFTLGQLFRVRTNLQRHALDQTKTMFLLWLCIVTGVVYANLSWYAFSHFNDFLVSITVEICVMTAQSWIIFALWYTNYRIALKRSLKSLSHAVSGPIFVDHRSPVEEVFDDNMEHMMQRVTSNDSGSGSEGVVVEVSKLDPLWSLRPKTDGKKDAFGHGKLYAPSLELSASASLCTVEVMPEPAPRQSLGTLALPPSQPPKRRFSTGCALLTTS
jgi:hypothetical protein